MVGDVAVHGLAVEWQAKQALKLARDWEERANGGERKVIRGLHARVIRVVIERHADFDQVPDKPLITEPAADP